jgi:hypothetical protein
MPWMGVVLAVQHPLMCEAPLSNRPWRDFVRRKRSAQVTGKPFEDMTWSFLGVQCWDVV